MATVKKLNAINTVDSSGNIISRNFKDMDDKLLEIEKKLANVTSGVTNFAYKDYTQAENQEEMEVGVIYLVPFNKSNQYIQLDPETNAPAEDQAPEVAGDTTIAYYIKCIKDSEGIVVSNDKIYTQGHLENVAYTNISNTFEQLQTFSKGISVTSGSTTDTLHATGEVTFDNNLTVSGDITATKGINLSTASGSSVVPNSGQIKAYVDGFLPEAKPESAFETDLSGSGLTPGKFFLYYAE